MAISRFDYRTCEPFRAWNRLEPRTRKVDFDEALRAEVRDPLWLLTRQWQFGEFKGEDTGSAIFAKVKLETSSITRYKSGMATAVDYSDEVPLETLVESEKMPSDYHSRVQVGRHWLKILRHYGDKFNDNPANTPVFEPEAYANLFKSKYSLQLPQPDAVIDAEAVLVQKAQLGTNHRLKAFLGAVGGRTFDGVTFYQDLSTSMSDALDDVTINDSHGTFISSAVTDFMAWFKRHFALATNQNSAWNPEQLEYQFACALPNSGTDAKNTVLAADEYYNGDLDWYAFDVDAAPTDSSGLLQSTPATQAAAIKSEIITVIPTEVRYAGMPNARWWEFEDGAVDLGNINAETTDIAKLILVEFALVYGNDWLSIPYTVPVGSLSEVKGIVVTDVFGQQTLVEPAIQGETDDWAGWGMFNLSTKQADRKEADTRLFIPPVITKVQESEPLEEVTFVRDEMANLVWAVETKIPNHLNEGMDGHSAAVELTNFLLQLDGATRTETEPVDGAILKYQFSNTVPENWIPFMPVHVPGQNRAIRLQRASMPRVMKEAYLPVRPRTEILRVGFQGDPTQEISPFVNPTREVQKTPYFIHEEEISRAGVKVLSTHQRTRWYHGKVYNWYGRRKTMGRGEGSSGLLYDSIVSLSK